MQMEQFEKRGDEIIYDGSVPEENDMEPAPTLDGDKNGGWRR